VLLSPHRLVSITVMLRRVSDMELTQIIEYCNANADSCWVLAEYVIQACFPEDSNIPQALYQGYISIAGGKTESILFLAGSCTEN